MEEHLFEMVGLLAFGVFKEEIQNLIISKGS